MLRSSDPPQADASGPGTMSTQSPDAAPRPEGALPSSGAPAHGTAASGEVARTAGRGVLYITAAKLFFIAAGYATHFALPRLLGSKELYGLYGLVLSISNVLSMVVVQATIQSVSKLVSEAEGRSADVRRAALLVQVVLGGGITLLYVGSADVIADLFSSGRLTAIGAQRIDDPAAMALYLRLSAGLVLAYAFYATFVGVLNGRREFRAQALFDMSYATLKTTLVIGAAALGFGMLGVFTGLAAAAVLIALVAAVIVGVRGGVGHRGYGGRLMRLMLPIMAYALVLNLLLTVDLWIVKALGPADLAATLGDYTAAQVVARIPYQAMLSVTFVVFPLISRSTFEGDREATAGYIRLTMRYSLIALAALVSVIGAAASDVIAVPYGAAYRTGGPYLAVLSAGMLCFALFNIAGTILNGAGRTLTALLLGLGTLAADVALGAILVPKMGALGGAWATLGALAAGLGVALWLLRWRFAASMPWPSAVRVALAGAAVVGVAQALPPTGLVATLGKCVLLLATYVVVLLATRELRPEDLARVRQVFARARPKPRPAAGGGAP